MFKKKEKKKKTGKQMTLLCWNYFKPHPLCRFDMIKKNESLYAYIVFRGLPVISCINVDFPVLHAGAWSAHALVAHLSVSPRNSHPLRVPFRIRTIHVLSCLHYSRVYHHALSLPKNSRSSFKTPYILQKIFLCDENSLYQADVTP